MGTVSQSACVGKYIDSL